jgi:hypothetical protein
MERIWKETGSPCAALGGGGVRLGGRHSLFYGVYLRSPIWRSRRWWWYVRSRRRCERCGRRIALHGRGTVTVHHRTYARLGHERRSDVELLCWGCHRRADWWRHR